MFVQHSTSHPKGFSFIVPLTLNQTVFTTLKKFEGPWMLELMARQGNNTSFC